MEIIIGIVVGAAIVSLFFLFTKKQNNADEIAKQLEGKFHEMFPRLLQNANQQLITMADQKLVAEKQEIKTDLSNKKTAIEDIVKRLHEELEKSNKRIEESDKDRVGSFKELKTEIEHNRKMTEQLSATADGLKKVLSNNQLRGQFGEQVAEDLLRMCGFVSGIDYLYNKALKESESRPDFTILLPDGVKINVDVKFPYANLQKMTETEDKAAKIEYVKAFERDVKEKVKQITGRSYINPQENTVDFVILFIPNEMIFSYMYEKMNETWSDAMKQKVIFAGPFNFTAILRLIRQSYANFTIQKDIKKIIAHIRTFEDEFAKYNEEFEKIGDRISSLSDQYDKVNITRTKKLVGAVDKIKLEETEVIALPVQSPLITPANES
jgi:DNA recombination protein RmuC